MSKEHPILFSTEMVKAILKGIKTQTRRVIKPQPEGQPMYCFAGSDRRDHNKWLHGGKRYTPPCRGDDILWVRETWADLRGMGFGNDPITDKPFNFSYKADIAPGSESDRCRKDYGVKWKPSIHMPREAARIFLTVKSVRVERLQDITEKDALVEGIKSYWADPHRDTCPFIGAAKEAGADLCFTRREAFQQLWDSLNQKRGYGWGTNPWVWVIEFERVEVPADENNI